MLKRELERKIRELEQSLAEKDFLLREAHDALMYAWLGLHNILGNEVAVNNYISVYKTWNKLRIAGCGGLV